MLAHLGRSLGEAHAILVGHPECLWDHNELAQQLICEHGVVFCLQSTLRECHFRDN